MKKWVTKIVLKGFKKCIIIKCLKTKVKKGGESQKENRSAVLDNGV